MASGVVDGAVIVDTSIKNDRSKIGAREFVNMVNNMNRAANQAGQRMSSSVSGYVTAMNRARDAAKGMKGDQAALAKEILRTSDAIRKMEERQEKAREKFDASKEDAIGRAMEKFEQDNAGAEFMPFKNEEQALEQLSEELNRVAQEAAEAFGTFEDTAAFRNSSVEIDYMKERLAALQAQLTGTAQAGGEAAQGVEEVAAAGAAGGGWAALGAVVGKAAGGFLKLAGHAAKAGASVAKIAGGAALSYLRKLAAGAKNAAIQLAKLAANAMKGGIKKLGGLIGGGVKSLLGFNRESQRGSNGLKQGLMMLLRYGLGIRGLFALFRRLRSAVAEGLGEIEKRNPRVKSAMDGLRGALNALKGAIGSAFAPIVTVVGPALTKLINMLTSAINAVGALIAALTGQKSYQKAVSGLNATGSAASGAAKDVKDLNRQLAGFDQLEILTAKDNGSGGSGGGGGGGGGLSYETEEISGGITDFVAKLKELWSNADYEGIGREIAGVINSAFEKAKDLISWDNLGAKITEVVTGITGIINGLVDGVNWTLIGETFGEGINTLIKTLNLLLTGIDWESIGTGFATGLNGLVKTVPWDELGQMLANRINALIGIIKGAVSKFNWGAAGTAFAATVNNLVSTVNWEDMATAATTGINGVISALRVAVNAFNWSYAATAFTNTVNGLLTGVKWDALAETASNSINKIVAALRLAVNNFKWDYAATAFANTLNGLITGVKWDDLSRLASESVNKIFSALRVTVNGFKWSYAATSFANACDTLVKGVDWGGIADTATAGANKILSSLRTTINGFDWSYAGKKFGQTLNNLISGFDWKNLGHLAQDAIAKPLSAIRIAVSEFDFSYAASSFAKTVNAFFDDPQMWKDAGQIVSDSIKGLFTWGAEFLNNLDVKQIATDIKAALKAVDWPGIAKKIWDFLIAAFQALGNFVYELLFPREATDRAVQAFVEDANVALGKSDLNFGLDPNFVPDKEKIEQLQTAISMSLAKGEWTTVPITLDVPPDSVEAARQQFIKRWNELHPEAPIPVTPELAKGSPTPAQVIGVTVQPVKVPVTPTKADDWKNKTLPSWLGIDKPLPALISLVKNKWTTIAAFVGTAVKVLTTLGKDGWSSIGKFVGTSVKVLTTLKKNKWSTIAKFVGNAVTVATSLKKSGWSSILSFITGNKNGKVGISLTLSSVASALKTAAGKLGIKLATGGIVTNGGGVRRFASGGVISGGLARYLGSVPHYASGTTRAHGTVFVAGEAGPEIMGHINGRTEILNKSQLAQTMYAAVYGGMVAALRGLTFRMPAMATGTVMPYEVAAQVARTGEDIQNTLDANNEDLIQTIISVVGAQTSAIVAALRGNQQTGPTGGLTAQQLINDINRRTQMFGASPLTGV